MYVQKKQMFIEKSKLIGYSPSLMSPCSSQKPTLSEYKARAERRRSEQREETQRRWRFSVLCCFLSVSFYNFHLPYKSLLKHVYNICCIICSLLIALIFLLRVSSLSFHAIFSALSFLPITAFCSLKPFVCSSFLHVPYIVYMEKIKNNLKLLIQ